MMITIAHETLNPPPSEITSIECPILAADFAQLYFDRICRNPFNKMHRESMERYDTLARGSRLLTRRGTRFAMAAPRGAAKSTIHSTLFPVMDICLQREKYIVVLSATMQQASQRLQSIRSHFINHQPMREAYGIDLKSCKTRNRRVLEINGVRVEAFGAGSEIRGIGFEGYRPTRVILDDVEHGRMARNAEARRQLIEWYNEVVENLGDGYTHIEVIGTLLHRDSLLSNLLKRPNFTSKVWQSVIHWAKNQELWENWKQIQSNLDNENREAESNEFYRANEPEMIAGAEVLWPEKESYLDLQIHMQNVGRLAFFKEKQNEPLNDDYHIFEWSKFRKFKWSEYHLVSETPEDDSVPDRIAAKSVHCDDLQYFGFLDPAMGNSQSVRRGDFAAIATVGRDKAGFFYLLDMWMERAPLQRQVEMIFTLHAKYQYTAFGYESNGFQDSLKNLLDTEQKTRRETAPPNEWQVPLQPQRHTQNKVARIQALHPVISAGWLRFLRGISEQFIQQVESFPSGKHDDGLDALAACVVLAQKAGAAPKIQLAGKPRPQPS